MTNTIPQDEQLTFNIRSTQIIAPNTNYSLTTPSLLHQNQHFDPNDEPISSPPAITTAISTGNISNHPTPTTTTTPTISSSPSLSLSVNNNAIDHTTTTSTPITQATDNVYSNSSIMNIQPTSFTKNHLINDGALSANDELSMKKRREDLTRRPSYRKIFNDLTGLTAPLDAPTVPLMSNPNLGHLQQQPQHHQPQQQHHHQQHQQDLPPPPLPHHQPQIISVAPTLQHHQQAHQHHQQHHQHQHHHQQPQQILPPPTPPHHHQAQQQQQQQATSHQQLNQPMKPNLAISPPITPGSGSSSMGGEEANKKRELRLQKNREAAKECRRKKKEYIKCLENRVAVLETQNKALIDELKTLKDLYCTKSANE